MEHTQFEKLQTVFEYLRELPEPDQRQLIELEAEGDPELMADLELLLANHRELEGRPTGEPATDSSIARRGLAEPDQTETLHEPEMFGRYRAIALVGRGGMGTVHLAIDTQLDREVALKRIRPELLLSTATRRRFVNETRAASRLDHPHICRVFDAGEHDGQPFLIMQHVRGESLAAKLGGAAPLDATQCLVWIEKIARGLHHAHERGLIHRDVKPSNILIDDSGEPFLVDFGLARMQGAGEALTATGEAPGTYRYMSPEQLRADNDALDPRTDVFSLAVVLAELLLVRHPFAVETDTDLEIVHRIQHTEPRLVSRSARRLGTDLTAVLRKALAKDPDLRYQNALEFAEDLARVRRHEPIAAVRHGRTWMVRHWVHKHQMLTMSLGMAAFAVVMLSLLWQRLAERMQLEHHVTHLEHVVATRDRLIDQPAGSPEALATAVATHDAWPSQATETALLSCVGNTGIACSINKLLTPNAQLGGRTPHEGERWAQFAADPSGKRLARVTTRGLVMITDITDNGVLKTFEANTWVSESGNILIFDASGERLFLGGGDGLIHIWNTANWEELQSIPLVPNPRDQLRAEGIEALCLSANGLLAAGGSAGHLLLWDLKTRHHESLPLDAQYANGALAFDSSGKHLLVAQRRALPYKFYRSLSVVDIDPATGTRHRVLRDFVDADMKSFCWHPESPVVVVGTTTGDLLAIDTRTGGPCVTLHADPRGNPAYVRWCGFDPTGRHLLAAFPSGMVVMDWHDGTVSQTAVIAHPKASPASAASFDHKGHLAILFGDGSLGLVATVDWQMKRLCHSNHLARALSQVAWVGSERLVTAANDCFDVWQPPPGNRMAPLLDHQGAVRSVDTHPESDVVIAADDDGVVVYDYATGAHQILPCDGEAQCQVRFSPDGRRFFSRGRRTVRVFATGGTAPILQQPGSLALFVDDHRLLIADDTKATLLDLDEHTHRVVKEMSGIKSATFDPASDSIFLGGYDRMVWQVFLDPSVPDNSLPNNARNPFGPQSVFGSTTSLAIVPGKRQLLAGAVNSYFAAHDFHDVHRPNSVVADGKDRFGGPIAVDPMARCAATADYSFGRLSWLDLTRRDVQVNVMEETDVHTPYPITAIRFSKSGKLCLTASLDGTVRLWDTATHTLRSTMRIEGTTIEDACFTADEEWFVTADGRGQVMRWPVDPLPEAKRYLEDLAKRSR